MNWLSLFAAAMKLMAAVADWLRARMLLTAGEARAFARSGRSPGGSSARARSSTPHTAMPSIATSARRSLASTVRSV